MPNELELIYSTNDANTIVSICRMIYCGDYGRRRLFASVIAKAQAGVPTVYGEPIPMLEYTKSLRKLRWWEREKEFLPGQKVLPFAEFKPLEIVRVAEGHDRSGRGIWLVNFEDGLRLSAGTRSQDPYTMFIRVMRVYVEKQQPRPQRYGRASVRIPMTQDEIRQRRVFRQQVERMTNSEYGRQLRTTSSRYEAYYGRCSNSS